jgi:hypothetical protein
MAAAMVTGAAAAVIAANPDMEPSGVKALLMSTAYELASADGAGSADVGGHHDPRTAAPRPRSSRRHVGGVQLVRGGARVGILLLSPTVVLAATLTGVLIGELVIRRAWIKVAYKVGSYTVASGAMIATYQVLMGFLGDTFGAAATPTSAVSMAWWPRPGSSLRSTRPCWHS